MPEQNKNDLQRMQREAEQRMREMQLRTSQFHNNHDTPQVPNFVRLNGSQNGRPAQSFSRYVPSSQPGSHQNATDKKTKKPLKRPADTNTHGTLNKGFNLLKMFNFQNFKLDSDITIIIVLILLVSSEETDELLMLALAYIML